MTTLTLGTLLVRLKADNSNYKKSIEEARRGNKDFSDSAKKIGLAVKASLAVAGAAALKYAAVSVKMARDAQESASKFKFVFGDATDSVEKKLNTFADAANRSRFQLTEMASDVGAIVGPILGSAEAAGNMSAQFAQLAVDLGSFHNVAEGDALQAIKAGLIGESEPLRRFGVLLSETAVQQKIFAEGWAQSKDEIDATMKVQARAALIMEQTSTAQNDAIRTGSSLANQQRGLAAATEELRTRYGAELIPAMESAISEGLRPMVDGLLDVKRATDDARESTEKFISQVLDVKSLQDYQQHLNKIARANDMLHGPFTPQGNVDVRQGALAILADYGRVAETTQELEIRMKTLGGELSSTGVEIDGIRVSWVELRREMDRINQMETFALMAQEAAAADRILKQHIPTVKRSAAAYFAVLEPSHNYADSLYDLSDASTESTLNLMELRREHWAQIQANEEAVLAQEQLNLAQEEAVRIAAEQQLALESLSTTTFATALEAESQRAAWEESALESTNWAAALYESASGLDLNTTQLRLLAQATGEYSESQIEAALNAAAMQLKIDSLAKAIANEEITVANALSELDNFQRGLENNTTAASDMADEVNNADEKTQNLHNTLLGIDGFVAEASVNFNVNGLGELSEADRLARKLGLNPDVVNAQGAADFDPLDIPLDIGSSGLSGGLRSASPLPPIAVESRGAPGQAGGGSGPNFYFDIDGFDTTTLQRAIRRLVQEELNKQGHRADSLRRMK